MSAFELLRGKETTPLIEKQSIGHKIFCVTTRKKAKYINPLLETSACD
jgi:hypothetical protein